MSELKTRGAVGQIGVWLALGIGSLGLVITFVPGGEAFWFGMTAGIAALGLLSPNWKFRLAGVVLAAVFALFAWQGYQRGQEYQRYLRESEPRIEELLRQHQAKKVNAHEQQSR